MGPLHILYIDMNSFFASVEQQLNPDIRNRPVAITAMENERGCCVAASYEAKAFGVKTGTSVPDARKLCPWIVFLPSRHRLYVRYNLRVAEVLDRYAELERIRSVDEFQIALSGAATTVQGASELVRTLKSAVATEVGPCLRFSAGVGPNHLLAKIAGKLEKPDGFQWLSTENMPERLAHLKRRSMITFRFSTDQDLPRVMEIWRRAVDATHPFLALPDKSAIEAELLEFLPQVRLELALDGAGRPQGFMFLHDGHLEALFVDPDQHGNGIGKAFISRAIAAHPDLTTDVNEQNPEALGFYEHLGFVRMGRSSHDGQGRPYPLIHLRYHAQM